MSQEQEAQEGGSGQTITVPSEQAINRMLQEGIHEALEALVKQEHRLRWFHFMHLPDDLRDISSHFAECAVRVVTFTIASTERSECLRQLLYAKDAAVRAMLETKGRAPFASKA